MISVGRRGTGERRERGNEEKVQTSAADGPGFDTSRHPYAPESFCSGARRVLKVSDRNQKK